MSGYVGINNIARKISKGYVGVTSTYTPVEYIESSGTQYIDTGVPASATLKTLCDMSTTTGGYPFGVTPAQNVKYYGANVSTTNQKIQSYFGTTSSYTTTNNVWTQGQRFILTANDNYKFYKDSTQIADYTTGTTKEFDSSLPITIFALNGLYLSSRITMKLYGFKMYDNGTLIRDYIPVVDDNNVACLWDNVEQRAYYNKGTGTFTAGNSTGGADITATRARRITSGYVGVNTGYTPIEYIESSGTQYINTGFKPNQNTNMQIDFQYLGQNSQVSSATSICIAGVRQVVASNKLVFWVEKATNKVALNYGTYDSGFINNTDCSQRTVLKNQGCNLLYNGTTVASSTSSNFTSTYNILLFGETSADGSVDLRGIEMKLYSFKIWDNDVLVRDFVPVLDENNVACLWDKVEEKAYYNAGTGTFTAGSTTGGEDIVISRARRIFGYTRLNYIEGTGTQYIDSGIVINDTTCIEAQFQRTTTSSDTYLCGAYQNGSGGQRYYVGSTSGSYFQAATTSSSWTSIASVNTNVNTIIYNNSSKKIVWNGTTLSYTTPTFGNANTLTLYIFTTANPEATKYRAKLFYFKISNRNTGELLRDFIPVLDINGVPCLYDKVSGNYFYNIGTGTFSYG